MQYFKNRLQAGDMLADQIEIRYHHTNCAVVALNDGAVMVGAQIALRLNALLTMLLTSPITLPRENDVLASVNQEGGLTYNGIYSSGELEEMQGEYRTYIDQKRQEGLHEINMALGANEVIRRDLLVDHNVILVSDGLNSAFSLEAAADLLKPVKTKNLIIATPLASVQAVDRMHVLADEIYCLNVVTDYMDTDHYYDIHDVPDHEGVIRTIQSAILQWSS